MQWIDLTAAQQRQALRLANVPEDEWPEDEVCIIEGIDGFLSLAIKNTDEGPTYLWDGKEWSPL